MPAADTFQLTKTLIGASREAIAEDYHISSGAVWDCISRLRRIIITDLPRPHSLRNFTPQDLDAEAQEFGRLSCFKGCVGIVDTTTIAIQRPLYLGERAIAYYSGHKKCYGVKLQGVVDHRGLFIDYAVGAPASTHDSNLLDQSQLPKHLTIHNQCKGIPPYRYIIGDGVYRADTYIIRPYRRAKATPKQLHFNSLLSSMYYTFVNPICYLT